MASRKLRKSRDPPDGSIGETQYCVWRNTVVSSYCVLIIIEQLKSLKFQSKVNYFETHAAGFVRLPYIVEKGKKVSKRFTSYYSIETR